MRKIISIISAFVITASLFCVSAEYSPHEKEITVTYNGNNVDFKGAAPQNIGGFTMVPMRAVFELAGCEVSFDTNTKTVTAKKDDTSVFLTIDKTEAFVEKNGKRENKKLDIAPCIISDRTLVPVRFISESLGFTVNWNPNYKEVVIIDFGKWESKLKEGIFGDVAELDFTKRKVHTVHGIIYADFDAENAYDAKIIADSSYNIYFKSDINSLLLKDVQNETEIGNIKNKYIKLSVPEYFYSVTGVKTESGKTLWSSFSEAVKNDEYIYSSTVKNIDDMISYLSHIKVKQGEKVRTSASTVIPKESEVIDISKIIAFS